jgi:inner membrane protease ATP23
MVVFMLKHLRLAGCPFPEDAFQCHPCPITTSGGFSPQYGILLCQNRVYYKKRMEDTMAHELIHAFDHCRFNVDWNNLRHHACSEVGAFIGINKDDRLMIDSCCESKWRLQLVQRD